MIDDLISDFIHIENLIWNINSDNFSNIVPQVQIYKDNYSLFISQTILNVIRQFPIKADALNELHELLFREGAITVDLNSKSEFISFLELRQVIINNPSQDFIVFALQMGNKELIQLMEDKNLVEPKHIEFLIVCHHNESAIHFLTKYNKWESVILSKLIEYSNITLLQYIIKNRKYKHENLVSYGIMYNSKNLLRYFEEYELNGDISSCGEPQLKIYNTNVFNFQFPVNICFLILNSCDLKEIPECINNLPLLYLNIAHNKIEELYLSIFTLRILIAMDNPIKYANFKNTPNLLRVYINTDQLSAVSRYECLRVCHLINLVDKEILVQSDIYCKIEEQIEVAIETRNYNNILNLLTKYQDCADVISHCFYSIAISYPKYIQCAIQLYAGIYKFLVIVDTEPCKKFIKIFNSCVKHANIIQTAFKELFETTHENYMLLFQALLYDSPKALREIKDLNLKNVSLQYYNGVSLDIFNLASLFEADECFNYLSQNEVPCLDITVLSRSKKIYDCQIMSKIPIVYSAFTAGYTQNFKDLKVDEEQLVYDCITGAMFSVLKNYTSEKMKALILYWSVQLKIYTISKYYASSANTLYDIKKIRIDQVCSDRIIAHLLSTQINETPLESNYINKNLDHSDESHAILIHGKQLTFAFHSKNFPLFYKKTPRSLLIEGNEIWTIAEIIEFTKNYLPQGLSHTGGTLRYDKSNNKWRFSLSFRFNDMGSKMKNNKQTSDEYTPHERPENSDMALKIQNVDNFEKFIIHIYDNIPGLKVIKVSDNFILNTSCTIDKCDYSYFFCKIQLVKAVQNNLISEDIANEILTVHTHKDKPKDLSNIIDKLGGYVFFHQDIKGGLMYHGVHVEWIQWISSAAELIMRSSSVYEMDASFKLKPLIYIDVQAVYGNVGYPISIFIGPGETEMAYSAIYNNMKKVFSNPTILDAKKFISDHGKALQAFKLKTSNMQLECLRHFLNRLGANTTLEKMASDVVFTMDIALALAKRDAYNEVVKILRITNAQQKAWNELNTNPESLLICYREHGITCSNHSESFHSIFNREVALHHATTLYEKIEVLFAIVQKRILHIECPTNEAALNEFKRVSKLNVQQIRMNSKCTICTKEIIQMRRNKFQCDFPCIHQILNFKGKDLPCPPCPDASIVELIRSQSIYKYQSNISTAGKNLKKNIVSSKIKIVDCDIPRLHEDNRYKRLAEYMISIKDDWTLHQAYNYIILNFQDSKYPCPESDDSKEYYIWLANLMKIFIQTSK